jgi:hypothetical protein
LGGCGFFYEHVQDPGTFVPVVTVTKAIRCEIITFLVANRLRKKEFLKEYQIDFRDAFERYAFLDLDEKEYGSVQADLKTIDSLGLSIGIDRKFTYGSTNQFSKVWHIGPALNGNWTYTRSNVFAVAQDATLGRSVRGQLLNPALSASANREDADFFCYKDSSVAPVATNSLDNAEALVRHSRPDLENFDRIWIAQIGEVTLARWLELMGEEMAKNYLAQGPYTESLIPGQINYTFSLEVKPSFDGKYTLISRLYNPYVPDLTASIDNTSTFSLYLNTPSSKAAYGGKNGTANLPTSPPVWKVGTTVIPAPESAKLQKETVGPVRPKRRLPSAPGQTPGVTFPAPLAIPAPPPAGQ